MDIYYPPPENSSIKPFSGRYFSIFQRFDEKQRPPRGESSHRRGTASSHAQGLAPKDPVSVKVLSGAAEVIGSALVIPVADGEGQILPAEHGHVGDLLQRKARLPHPELRPADADDALGRRAHGVIRQDLREGLAAVGKELAGDVVLHDPAQLPVLPRVPLGDRPEGDAGALANYYGLKNDQWSYLATPLSRRVYLLKFVPRAVRTVSGGGKIYADLVQVVSNRVGAMTAVDDGTFFLRYEYESASGVSVQLSKLGGLVVSNTTYSIRADVERLEAARLDAKAAVSETAAFATRRLAGDMVKIPGRQYAISKHEVSQALWYAVTGEVPSRFTGGDLPVESVSWDDCQTFLEKLNALPEVRASGFIYRLPTAAEWEYACRAGATGDYCRLEDGAEVTSATLKNVAWYGEDRTKGTTHPVGQKKPNAFGLYDMHGNVWEWVADGEGGSRTDCGGGWRNGASTCTSGSKFRHFGEFSRDDIGLRLAADCQ